jgi:NAD(P)-dependent dehydrogenase (short-subunit alcohol dehydrogenase family)
VTGVVEGRVAVVTGAGGGIGRGHALEFARQGASVVVNDRGVALDGGAGGGASPADAVVAEIEEAGGVAVANHDDVASWDGAQRLVEQALSVFGSLDVVVNNAGILRDRMLVTMTLDDWEAVLRVHLGGTFCVTRAAAAWWRDQSKAGQPRDARVINTGSSAGLYGHPGQANYTAAKAGIVGFSATAAAELARYGVTVNVVLPGGRTRMTEGLFEGVMPEVVGGFDPTDPTNVAPFVVWLASADSAGITGRVFEAWGGRIGVVDGWQPGPREERVGRWDPAEIGPVVRQLLDRARPVLSMLDASL